MEGTDKYMKKIIGLYFLIVLFVFAVSPAYAKTGDVTGNIYSTDILATFNGFPIQSYNIGGKTAIIIEDLQEYGFYISYDNDFRLLNADIGNGIVSAQVETITRGKVGNITGNIYETDIVVFLNGEKIDSYNIGGKTCVCIEDLGSMTDSPNTEYGYSKYYMNCE